LSAPDPPEATTRWPWLCGPATPPGFLSPWRAPCAWPGVRPGGKV